MINETQLKAEIKAALDSTSDTVIDPAVGREQAAEAIAAAVVKQLKNIQITYTAGLVAPPSGGPVTGVLNYTIT